MRAEIISIGTEILIGSITNTNSRFLSEQLAQNAIDVYHHVTVGDNVVRLIDCLETAASRSDLIITSGGLGPTEDDITLEAILKFLNVKSIFHAPTHHHIQSRLQKAGLRLTKLALRQCLVPRGALVFKNEKGAAPGLLMSFLRQEKKKWLLVLPGPPRELEPLLLTLALPALLKKAGIKRETFLIKNILITGLTETQVAEKIGNLLALRPPLTVGIYAKPGLVTLKIMAKAPHFSLAQKNILKIENKIKQYLGSTVFGADHDTLSSVLGELLRKKRKTLAVAESCTGGLLGSLLTDTPGSSTYFKGGVIAYDNQIKIDRLGINPQTLKKYGAVSKPIASEMSQGARLGFDAKIGIGITGIAGPDGATPSKPVGLVFISISTQKHLKVYRCFFTGNRHEIKSRAAHKALDLVRLFLLEVE